MRSLLPTIALSLLAFGPAAVAGEINLAIAESLAAAERPAADLRNDPLRRPDLVLAFFGIAPGMSVLDLFSGGGYYTEIVSRVTGPDGRVVAHNNQAYLKFAADSLAGRFEDDRLANVERVEAEANELELPPAGFDAVLAMLTWHDLYYVDEENGWPAIDAAALIENLCTWLQPGGVLGITDHVAVAGSDPMQTAQALHRIDPQRIRDDLTQSCFSFEGEIDVLRNPGDDHDQPMYVEGIRGKTDRVVYRFRRN